MTISPEDLVRREVHYCVSYLVSTLASAAYTGESSAEGTDLQSLAEQAFELARSDADWEETAIQNSAVLRAIGGWRFDDGRDGVYVAAEDWCEAAGICDPVYREIFEHWIVGDWLADKLAAHGEKVDKDFAGMIVWARTTSGQGIASDSVIEAICAELNAA